MSVWEKEALFCLASEATWSRPRRSASPRGVLSCRCSRAFKAVSARSRWIRAWSRWRRVQTSPDMDNSVSFGFWDQAVFSVTFAAASFRCVASPPSIEAPKLSGKSGQVDNPDNRSGSFAATGCSRSCCPPSQDAGGPMQNGKHTPLRPLRLCSLVQEFFSTCLSDLGVEAGRCFSPA